jgi:hypothetical protein
MSFFDEYETAEAREAPAPSSQGDATDVCAFCGWADDDVLLGVCADCARD